MYFATVINYMITNNFLTESSAGTPWTSNCWIFYFHGLVFDLSFGAKVREGNLRNPWSQRSYGNDCHENAQHAFGLLSWGNFSVTYPVTGQTYYCSWKLSACHKWTPPGISIEAHASPPPRAPCNDGIESTCTRFADDTKPAGDKNTLEGWYIYRDTWSGWKSRQARTTGSLTKTSAKFCIWSRIIKEPS